MPWYGNSIAKQNSFFVWSHFHVIFCTYSYNNSVQTRPWLNFIVYVAEKLSRFSYLHIYYKIQILSQITTKLCNLFQKQSLAFNIPSCSCVRDEINDMAKHVFVHVEGQINEAPIHSTSVSPSVSSVISAFISARYNNDPLDSEPRFVERSWRFDKCL